MLENLQQCIWLTEGQGHKEKEDKLDVNIQNPIPTHQEGNIPLVWESVENPSMTSKNMTQSTPRKLKEPIRKSGKILTRNVT